MSVLINGTTYPAEYMTSPEQIMQGMMGREELNGCMVFEVGLGHHKFWMKDCKISLDIVFVNNNRISRIHNSCQPCDDDCVERYTGIGDKVLEFPAETASQWRVGDRVNFLTH